MYMINLTHNSNKRFIINKIQRNKKFFEEQISL